MQRILVAEDDELIAMAIADLLDELGYEIVGPAGSVAQALDLIDRQSCDGAILDIALIDGESYPAAEQLQARAIPYAFSTGRGIDGIDGRFRDVPVLAKPFDVETIRRLLVALMEARLQRS